MCGRELKKVFVVLVLASISLTALCNVEKCIKDAEDAYDKCIKRADSRYSTAQELCNEMSGKNRADCLVTAREMYNEDYKMCKRILKAEIKRCKKE
ncbi:MAG: hypothetical protein WAX69_23610 [Victivallales bacterium]